MPHSAVVNDGFTEVSQRVADYALDQVLANCRHSLHDLEYYFYDHSDSELIIRALAPVMGDLRRLYFSILLLLAKKYSDMNLGDNRVLMPPFYRFSNLE